MHADRALALFQVPLAGMMFPDNRLLIALGVLMTYEHMGYARLDCIGGCFCPPREINLLHPFKYDLFSSSRRLQSWQASPSITNLCS